MRNTDQWLPQAEGVRMGSDMGSVVHFIVPKCSTIT